MPTKKVARPARKGRSKSKPRNAFEFDEQKLLAHVENVQAERKQIEKANPDD